ncbi:hypothetical protein [Enterobacter hormaechei]|uniref:hypothetical protein n=1 Tax=Enterobacter hormaechei TaxID=158836 RepID=UPI003525C621
MKLNYEELEARCAALAAENAGLKSAIDATIGWQQSTDPENVESVRMLVDIKTPATDPFLAEVRAQGVDSAINTVIAMMNHQHPVTSKAIDILRVHAYQIRKGVQS